MNQERDDEPGVDSGLEDDRSPEPHQASRVAFADVVANEPLAVTYEYENSRSSDSRECACLLL